MINLRTSDVGITSSTVRQGSSRFNQKRGLVICFTAPVRRDGSHGSVLVLVLVLVLVPGG
ncbi:hypothetical protein ABT147_11625 [Streptomyces sp. NPDC001868]|uniref:hypothetical protein n=1 Tax=Streptomyces sp. NPDC001868 TaxID=3154401 RepID=UPI00332546C5